MSTEGGKGEEADVLGGMPPVAPALIPLYRLGRWTSGGGGNGNLEKVSQSHGHKMEAILLKDVWIHQEYDCDHFGARHPPLHTGIPGVHTPDQCAAATVGRWNRAKPMQVNMTGVTIPTHPRRYPNTTHTSAHHHQQPQAERAGGIKRCQKDR